MSKDETREVDPRPVDTISGKNIGNGACTGRECDLHETTVRHKRRRVGRPGNVRDRRAAAYPVRPRNEIRIDHGAPVKRVDVPEAVVREERRPHACNRAHIAYGEYLLPRLYRRERSADGTTGRRDEERVRVLRGVDSGLDDGNDDPS